MQKYFILFIITLSLFSCDKNKDFPQYTSLYHIDGNDTISAIYIPNAFTPNGNGINDGFKIIINGIDSARIVIYNRNGELFYSSRFVDVYGWDANHKGLNVENGNYHFKFYAKDSTGFIFNHEGIIEVIK